MADLDQEDRDEVQADYDNERRYHASRSSPPFPKGGKIARYLKLYDYADGASDAVYFDRTMGERVMRYDIGDSANTDPFYGASTDEEEFAKRGMDLMELIDPSEQKVADHELRAKVQSTPPWEYDWDDEGDIDYPEDEE